MKRLWLLIAMGGILCPLNSVAQDACVKARKLLEKINSIHIEPRNVNDSLSADIFSEFFQILDNDGTLFVSKDTGNLVSYRNKLDGNEPVCSFLTASRSLYKKKLEWYRKFTDSVLAKPLDLTKTEVGPPVLDNSHDIAKTTKELKAKIIKDLKVSVLLAVYRRAAADSTILTDANAFAKAEAIARQRVKKNELSELEKFLKDDKALTSDVEDSYLKAIPAVFDPHSTFFSKEEMDEFNEGLNPSALSFGIKLTQSAMGEVSISQVVPGSPAWTSNQVNKGDVLIGLQWKPSDEYVDLADLDIESIGDIIDKPGETQAEFTIRKATGETRKVKLVKAKIENEENIVSGFVLKGKGSKRSIGYISLPGFFTAEDQEMSGCAAAVTKEIIKLKGESIEGLILDLRFNGGGSLFEAVELAGLFIDVGPVGVVELRGHAPETLKDMNRGLVYDGPLVIMVNGASASASEVVSAALQDYDRAIIAGSVTFGKATGQSLMALNEKDSTQGFLKVTQMRIYRIDGTSHQGSGVSPDFPIRDLSSVIYLREGNMPHALQPRAIKKKTYYTRWSKSFSDEVVKYWLNADTKATTSDNLSNLGKIFQENIPLERKAFVAFMKNMESISRRVGQGVGSSGIYTVSNSRFDQTVLKDDSYHAEINKEILSQVSSSIYIQDAYRLLDNLITGKK
ncbi:MAG: S41 family peptidase [Bacteroidota bacterium]